MKFVFLHQALQEQLQHPGKLCILPLKRCTQSSLPKITGVNSCSLCLHCWGSLSFIGSGYVPDVVPGLAMVPILCTLWLLILSLLCHCIWRALRICGSSGPLKLRERCLMKHSVCTCHPEVLFCAQWCVIVWMPFLTEFQGEGKTGAYQPYSFQT